MKNIHVMIQQLKVKKNILPVEEINKRINFLKDYLLNHTEIQTLVIGISGGQDSTLSGKLCQLAINKINNTLAIKKYKCIAIRLPYGIQSDENDCKTAINFINPNQTISIDIKKIVCTTINSLLKNNIILSESDKGNLKSRIRMQIIYSIAAQNKGIVVGTSNANEIITGFFTKHGDGASDINPIRSLNKRQGKILLKTLNCPQQLYLKDPIAGLEDNAPYKTDEEILGISYETIDNFLEGRTIPNNEIEKIKYWYYKNNHKRLYPFI
ncbi:NH(3)-dependent NAD(+) synthetase [Buchnera aphidicola (Thelaxes suberi)]|uniref:ammonia-dependent NAD(+) synthetase n=1 Tax=Buchnera aphidicola TaxID=9 RepID=UPI003464CC58